ncbi:MAG: hypothetical protein ACI8Q1_000222 [Parvicella sp.]|jgi:hypothetical protein
MAVLLANKTNDTPGASIPVTASQLRVNTKGLVGKTSRVMLMTSIDDVVFNDYAQVKNGDENIYIADGSGFVKAKVIHRSQSAASYSIDVTVSFA